MSKSNISIKETNNLKTLNNEESTTSKVQSITVDEAIEILGSGNFQRRVLISTGLCFAADSMEVMMLSFLSPVLKDEWDLSFAQSAAIASVVFAGAMCGTLILGSLGDVYGRRPMYLVAALIVTVFGFATALADSYIVLLIMRFWVGVGVGGLTVPFDILAEFLPASIRGKYLLYIEYFWGVGSLSMPLVAYLTIGVGLSWKWFVLVCAVPCLIGSIGGTLFVPESPHFLASRGRTDEALDTLRYAAKVNGKDPYELFPQHVILRREEAENASYAELFKPKWRKLTLIVWGLWFGLAFSYYGALLTITRVFEIDDEDDDDNNDDDDEDVSFDYLSIFLSATAEIAGVALVACTVDRYGRVLSQVLFYVLGAIFLYTLCMTSDYVSTAIATIFAFLARIFEMSATCCTWVATAELFGTEVRTTGHSSASAVARIGGIICPFLVESSIPLPIVGAVILVVHVSTIFFVIQTPETYGKQMGKAFEHESNEDNNKLLEPLLEDEQSHQLS